MGKSCVNSSTLIFVKFHIIFKIFRLHSLYELFVSSQKEGCIFLLILFHFHFSENRNKIFFPLVMFLYQYFSISQ